MYDYTDIQCRLLESIDKNNKNQKGKIKLRSNEQLKKPKYFRNVYQPYFRQSKNFLKLQDEYDRIKRIEREIMECNDWEWEWYIEQQEYERKKSEEDDVNHYN